MLTSTWKFTTFDERETFLAREFPDRVKDEHIPGLYHLVGRKGVTVGVFMNTVTRCTPE